MPTLVIELEVDDVSPGLDPVWIAESCLVWPHEIEVEGDETYFSIKKAKWKK